jgi:hypothetical protein
MTKGTFDRNARRAPAQPEVASRIVEPLQT